MGHSAHFLSRLQRLKGDAQLELALALYREPDAVRLAVAGAGAGPDYERIAIALGEGREPPHAIVTRGGAFVTCLGAGMRVRQSHVVPVAEARRAIETVARLDRTRDRLELRGGVDGLFDRLLKAGPRLAREDFEALWALGPILADSILDLHQALHKTLADIRRGVGARDRRRRGRATDELMRSYGLGVEAMGHLTLLYGTLDPDMLTGKLGQHGFSIDPLTASVCVLLEAGPMIRGAWLLGHLGPPIEARLRRQWRGAGSFIEAAQAACGLVAIAARHGQYEKTIRNVLADRSAPVYRRKLDTSALDLMMSAVDMAFDEPEATWTILRTMWIESTEFAPGDPTPTPDEVPMELVGPWMIADGGPLWHEKNFDPLLRLGWMSVWAARQEAADLYLPAEAARMLNMSGDPERARESIRLNQDYFGYKRPARAKAKVGRNDPCPCGSGRKYKRCCLRGER